MKTAQSIIGVLFVLLTAQIASAYYCPSTGRWLSRDPIGEAGLQALFVAGQTSIGSALRTSTDRWITRDPVPSLEEKSIYAFIENKPVSYVDNLGLTCQCGVKSLKAISDGWAVNQNSIAFNFHVTARFRKDAGYVPSCCKVVQWIKDTATRNGAYPSVSGNPPRDGQLHIDNNPYAGDDVTSPSTGMAGYDSNPADDVFTYADTPTRHANNGDVLAGSKVFQIVIYDSCNKFKKVSSTSFEIYTHGTWPNVDFGVK